MNEPIAPMAFEDPSLQAVSDQQDKAVGYDKGTDKEEESTADLIRQFESENMLPDVDKEILRSMDDQRKYIHTEANLPTTVGGVSTNYLYKFQRIHKAQINARDPQVTVRPKKRIGEIDPAVDKLMKDFAATMQALITHYFSADEMNLKQILDGAIQDVDTVGIVFLKLDWLEDMDRDPVGTWRPQDFQQTMARMKVLLGKKKRGECKEGDASYQDLIDTAKLIKKQVEAEFWMKVAFNGQMPMDQDPREIRWEGGIPTEPQLVELPKYHGFVLRTIMPEDVRRDWSIFKPEEFKRSKHFCYCLRMTEDDIRKFYNLADDESLLPFTSEANVQDADKPQQGPEYNPANRDNPEPQNKGSELVVWCRMDRARNKIYHWIQGAKKFLRCETPEVSSTNWYNVWPVMFNRVTGRFLPISNTTLGKPLQEEINLVRTHKRAAKKRAYDSYLFEQGLFDDDDLERLRNRPPGSFTPTKKTIEDIKKGIFPMPGRYDPMVHDVLEERQELGSILNQSQAAQGMTRGGADSATEAAIANQTGDLISNDDQDDLEAIIRDLAFAMGEVLVQALPEENAKAVAGPGAVWPTFEKEQIWSHLLVEIEAGSTGVPNMGKRLESLKTAFEIGTAAGMGQIPGGPIWNPVAVVKMIADIMGWKDDPKDLFIMPQPAPVVTAPGGAVPGRGGPAAGGPATPGTVPAAPPGPGAEMNREVSGAAPTLPLLNNPPAPMGA